MQPFPIGRGHPGTRLTYVLLTATGMSAMALDRPPDVIWARSGGGPTSGRGDTISAVAAAADGSVYATGKFSRFARYGSHEIASSGTGEDFLLLKYDPDGNVVWVRHGNGSDGVSPGGRGSRGDHVVVGPDGNIFVAGSGSPPPVTIDGAVIPASGDYETPYGGVRHPTFFRFLAKYDPNGRQLWIHSANTMDYGGPTALAVDPAGNAYLGGTFWEVIDFEGRAVMDVGDNGDVPGTLPLSPFVARFNPAGEFQWVKRLSHGNNSNYLKSLAADLEGNLYLVGTSSTRPDSAPAVLGSNQVPVAGGTYVAKLDSAGAVLWTMPLTDNDPFGPDPSLKIDDFGNTFVLAPSSNESTNSQLVRLDGYGNFQWKRSSGSYNGAFTVDSLGGVVTVSMFYAGSFTTTTGEPTGVAGDRAGVGLVAYAPSGEMRWAAYLESPRDRHPGVSSITQTASGSYHVGGFFNHVTGLGPHRLESPWTDDDTEGFVAKLAHPVAGDRPAITLQPRDVTGFEGTPVQLRVAASSLSPLAYQWQFNGLPITGATSDTLTYAPSTVDVDGEFSVAVGNAHGTTVSSVATVDLLPLARLGEALNSPELSWRAGGSASWQVDTNTTHDGQLSARTARLDPDYNPLGGSPGRTTSDCWVETTVTGPGVLSYWWKASVNEGQYEYFVFSVDGIETHKIHGEVDWQARSQVIGAGSHRIRWRWSLAFGPRNQNLCWLDQVRFQAQTGSPSRIGEAGVLPDGRFRFTIHGPAGARYGVEASSDLVHWLPIGQVTSPDGSAPFTHASAGNFTVHYYRAVLMGP